MLNTLVFDIDDTCYTIASGLHDRIKARICPHANATPEIRARAQEWLGEDRDFRKGDLGKAFPKIVTACKERGDVAQYFDAVYGNDYHLVEPDPRLIGAMQEARRHGVRLMVYSNGPSSPTPGEDFHIQKILRRLGADDELVEHLRGQTYDLLKSVEDGAGKPTPEGLRNFLTIMNVNPHESMMYDDDFNMVMTAAGAGMKAGWVRTPGMKPTTREFMGRAAHWNVMVVSHPAEAVEALLKADLAKTLKELKAQWGRSGRPFGLGPGWEDYGLSPHAP